MIVDEKDVKVKMIVDEKDVKDLALSVWRIVDNNPTFDCQDCFDALDDELKEKIIWSKDIFSFFNYCYSRAKILEGVKKLYGRRMYHNQGIAEYVYHCSSFANSVEAVKNK